jgi:predicted dehydrogenase
MNRRTFLRRVGTAGAVLSACAPFHGLADVSSRKLRVGLIGSGWYGKIDLLRLMQVAPVEVVSLCDVDSKMLEEAAEIVASRQVSKKKPRTYRDYRPMLKEKDLDIVIVATPDHWHCLPAIAAIEAGAHVYLQKPISVDIAEGQAILAAARRHKRVVQVGTQRRSTPHLIEAMNLVKEGKLGKIAHVEMCCYSSRNPQNPPDTAPPDHLDWEMWTGPAPMRPYNRMAHPRGWRNFTEYGNGLVGDMCIHMLDMARWMLDLGSPTTVSSTGGILVHKGSKPNTPDTQSAFWNFGDLRLVWQHRTWGAPPDPKYPWAAIFYGDKGTLKASVRSFDFIPVKEGTPVQRDVQMELEEYPEDKTERDLERHVAPAVRYHMKDFLECIESGRKPVADIEEGHISTLSCILANMSMELGRSLEWDAAAGTIKGDEDAKKLLRRPYRAPWVHPEPV